MIQDFRCYYTVDGEQNKMDRECLSASIFEDYVRKESVK